MCCNAIRVRIVPIVSYVNPSITSTCSLRFLLSRHVISFRPLLLSCSLLTAIRLSSCFCSSLVSLCSFSNVCSRNDWLVLSSFRCSVLLLFSPLHLSSRLFEQPKCTRPVARFLVPAAPYCIVPPLGINGLLKIRTCPSYRRPSG